jgi:molybdate transport system substrate-binding protein
MKRRLVPVAVFAALTLALAACSNSSGSASGSGSNAPPATKTTLTVFAAASLAKAFPVIGTMFTKLHPGVAVRYQFAGTDQLAAQIEQGAPADVFAGASTTYGDELASKGLIDVPQPFATNRLVLILPPSNPANITSLADLTRPGIKLVVAGPTVPAGAYTRKVLTNLDASYGAKYDSKVLANVVSNEDSVTGVVQKVQLGEADAGFVYVTDAKSAGGAVKPIELPTAAQAIATYPIATVKAGSHQTEGRQYVDFVLSPAAQAVLASYEFGPPPSG